MIKNLKSDPILIILINSSGIFFLSLFIQFNEKKIYF